MWLILIEVYHLIESSQRASKIVKAIRMAKPRLFETVIALSTTPQLLLLAEQDAMIPDDLLLPGPQQPTK